jgi:hypothetical protein
MEEKILFNLLKEKLIVDLEPTDQYNPTDGTSIKYELSIELKCRSKYYGFLLIEKNKWDKLSLAKNARYINSIPNGRDNLTYEVYSFDIKKLSQPHWFYKWCKETTQFGPPVYVRKLVGLLDNKKAKNLTDKLFC